MNTTSFQGSNYSHFQQTQILGTSGLKILDGQDLTYGDRKRLQQLQANSWYKQQMEEKQKKLKREKFQKQLFDQQTLQINQYRRQLQQQKAKRLRDVELAYKTSNKEQLQQKLTKEEIQRKLEQEERLNHIDYLTKNDFYTENTATCQSQLGRNRVKPYHWKGMNEQQRNQILQQQQKQRQQKNLQKKIEMEEQRLFAQQMQAQRKAIVLQDRAKNRGLKDVRKGVDEYNKMKAQQMKRKAYHAFDNVHTYKNQG